MCVYDLTHHMRVRIYTSCDMKPNAYTRHSCTRSTKLWNVLMSNKTTYISYSKFAQYYPIPNLFHVLTGSRHCCYFFFFFFFIIIIVIIVTATFFFSFGGWQTTSKRFIVSGWPEVLLQPYYIIQYTDYILSSESLAPWAAHHLSADPAEWTPILFSSLLHISYRALGHVPLSWLQEPSPLRYSLFNAACFLTLGGVVTISSLQSPPAHPIPNLGIDGRLCFVRAKIQKNPCCCVTFGWVKMLFTIYENT